MPFSRRRAVERPDLAVLAADIGKHAEHVFLLLPPLLAGGGRGKAFDLEIKSDPTLALPCKQGRERGLAGSWLFMRVKHHYYKCTYMCLDV